MDFTKRSKQQLIDEITRLQKELEDIDSLKAAYLESEQRLSDIIDFLPDATFAIDLDGTIIAWNRAIETMTGVPKEEMIGKGNYEYSLPFYGKRRPILIDLIYVPDEEIATKYHFVKKENDTLLAEADVDFGQNGLRHLWGKAGPLYDSNGNMVGAIESIRDITDQRTAEREQKRLEKYLQRAEKMESLGTLAGGVAHDLNNVLGVITGYAELMLHQESLQSSNRSRLSNIMKSGERAAAIVQDLLTLARRGVYNYQPTNINDIIEELFVSLEFERLRIHHPRVTLRTELKDQLPNISGSAIHFSKSLFNLICNAMESMPNGGDLYIKTDIEQLEHPVEGYDQVVSGEYVILAVSDTGDGIPEKDLQRIFEPFYTKKVMGKSGTGLGLAVVWGTVEDHNGYVQVRSKEGEGSTFILYIPSTRDMTLQGSFEIDASQYMGNKETVLVIDDVLEQRELATELLTQLNYSVSHVGSGEEAIDFLKAQAVDIIVLDMIMDPGMDGLDTYTAILDMWPKQKAIIVSGYAETERVTQTQSLGAGSYLRKPYRAEQLGNAIRKELDRLT